MEVSIKFSHLLHLNMNVDMDVYILSVSMRTESCGAGLELGVALFVLTPLQTYQLKRLVRKNGGV